MIFEYTYENQVYQVVIKPSRLIRTQINIWVTNMQSNEIIYVYKRHSSTGYIKVLFDDIIKKYHKKVEDLKNTLDRRFKRSIKVYEIRNPQEFEKRNKEDISDMIYKEKEIKFNMFGGGRRAGRRFYNRYPF